jgi:hypothetical protein
MSEDKVVGFPGARGKFPIRALPAQQLSLFDHRGDNCGKIAFVDVRWFAEETFLNLMSRNGVSTLVDLRPRPVFERPHFRHRHVVHYFCQHSVHYLEYAMLARKTTEDWIRPNAWPLGAQAQMNEVLSRGLTVCLFDEGSRSAGWIDAVRHMIRLTPSYRAEVHPRALVGIPEAVGSR